ncbi:hypothetical protein [Leptospira jelokensis]|uniref:hypothetical protein n=1 Tax=Leptospira jelokensis TaxID=2484931 RepID=UPI001091627B|nr:hypothetical protein [Leptospira jelokensis]TGM06161.1 hypothetical protein EHQ79_02260 [Leptospira jelokensis]
MSGLLAVFLVHLIVCSMMVILIWVIQILHYPSFYFIEPSQFSKFHSFHSNRITWLVAPIMGIELFTAMALIYHFSNSILFQINLVGVLVLWGLTFFVSVPIHNKLKFGKEEHQIKRLIQTNWFRTMLWSFRLILLLCSYHLLLV